GLPPMSQFDARADGLSGIFSRTADARPYRHRESQVDVNETNMAGAFGQAESDSMDFSIAALVPHPALHRIPWYSPPAPAPPPPPPPGGGGGVARGSGPGAAVRSDEDD